MSENNLKWWIGGAISLAALLKGLDYYNIHYRSNLSDNNKIEQTQSGPRGPMHLQPFPQSKQPEVPSWNEEYEMQERAEKQRREWQNLSKIPTENLTLQQAVWKAFYTRHFGNDYEKAENANFLDVFVE